MTETPLQPGLLHESCACEFEEACWAHCAWINPSRFFSFADGIYLRQFIIHQISGCVLGEPGVS